jgi:hypothetical protein
VLAAFLQRREKRIDALQIPPAGALAIGAEQQILFDSEAGEQTPPFWH